MSAARRNRVQEVAVRLVFIDDSGQSVPPRRGLGELVALGGVVVPEAAVAGYATDLEVIRADLGVPADVELKWYAPRGSFLAAAGGELVGSLRRRMLHAAIDRDVHSVVVVWDRGLVPWGRDQVARELLKYLYERVSMCLGDDVGIIIADEPGGPARAHERWLATTLTLTRRGTTYVSPERVVLPIVTAPSHHVPHLQLADLVVAATTAAVAGRPAGLALAPLLRELAHKNARGYAGGAGIKLFPDELLNLYWWTFDEEAFWRVATGESWTLPLSELPFETDDGLLAHDRAPG
jgi:Protein of unknown function (DUF3800)